jgi:hypothetical protein
MPGKKSRIELLHAERQILLAESELNRIQLLQEIERLRHECHRVAETLKTAGSVASSVAKAGALFLFVRRLFRGTGAKSDSNAKPAKNSFIPNLLKGLGAGFSFWESIRSRR